MEGNLSGFLMAFLLPFHLGGGAALGFALRNIFQAGFSLSSIARNGFWLIWGSTFGGLPLIFGLGVGSPWFVALELGILLGAIVLVAVGYEWLRALYSQPGMFVASFGFIFLLVGAALTTTLLGGNVVEGAPIGLIFVGVGGLITVSGVWMLLRVR